MLEPHLKNHTPFGRSKARWFLEMGDKSSKDRDKKKKQHDKEVAEVNRYPSRR